MPTSLLTDSILDGLNPEQRAAVLAWTNTLVDRLNGHKGSGQPLGSWLLRALGRAAVERDARMGPTGDTFRRLDRAVAFVAFGSGRPANSSYDTPINGTFWHAFVPRQRGRITQSIRKTGGCAASKVTMK